MKPGARRAGRALAPRVALLCALSLLAACSKGAEGSAEKLCASVRANPSVSTLFAGFDPSDAPNAVEQLRTARVTLGELRRAAPDEVRDEIDVEISYVQDLIDGLSADKDLDATRAAEIVRAVTAEHPDVSKASAALETFSQKSCPPG